MDTAQQLNLQKNLVVANQDFRKTQAGMTLGKLLFDKNRQSAIENNPALIVSLLQAAGVPVPKGVVVTADVAQILVSGGAICTAAERGADWKALVQPSVSVAKTAVAVCEMTGLLDPKSPLAQELTIGTDVALVVSSGGTNVLADIQTVFDIYSCVEAFQFAAKAASVQNAQAFLKARKQAQLGAFATNFADYHQGKLDSFTFMGKVAQESPDYFESFFPEFGAWIPQTVDKYSIRGDARSFWGDHKTYYTEVDIPTVINDHKIITDGIVMKYAGESLAIFKAIQLNYSSKQIYDSVGFYKPLKQRNYPITDRISLIDFAALSMIPPYIQHIPPDFDIGPLLISLGLTPSDFGSSAVLQGTMSPDYFPNQLEVELNSPIQFYPSQGMPTETIVSKSKIQQQKNLNYYDQNGYIANLLHDPIGALIVKEWGTVPRFGGLRMLNVPQIAMKYAGIANIPNLFDNLPINQLWTCLGYLKQLENDQFFSDFDFLPIDFPGWYDAIHTRVQELQLKILARRLNATGLENIAMFLGCPVNKIRRVPLQPGQLAQYYSV